MSRKRRQDRSKPKGPNPSEQFFLNTDPSKAIMNTEEIHSTNSSQNFSDLNDQDSSNQIENSFETPNDLKTAPDTIGEYFKFIRNKQGLGLDQVSQITKINLSKLEFLEAENFEQLPNRTYVQGYAKTLCRLFKVNYDPVNEMINQAYGQKFDEIKVQTHIPLPKDPGMENGPFVTPKFLIFALVTLALLVGLYFVFKGMAEQEVKTVKEIPLPTTPTSQKLSAQSPLKEKIAEPIKVLEKKGPLVKDPSPVEAIDLKAEEEVTETTQEKRKWPRTNFSKFKNPLFSVDTAMTDQEMGDLIPENKKSDFEISKQAGGQSLFIVASSGDSWMTFKLKDNPIRKFILKQGETLSLNSEEIRLFLGNSNALKLFYNGAPLTIRTSSGVKSLVFPPSNAKKYVIPLFLYTEKGESITSDEFFKTPEGQTDLKEQNLDL